MGICNLGGVKTGTAQEADVRGGKTFMNSTGVHTGTATNHGNVTLRPSGNESVRSGSGFYDSVTADGSQSYNNGYTNGRAATKKLRSFKLHLSVMHNYNQHYDQDVTVTCNYDSDNNFTGFSATSTPATNGGIAGEYHYASIGEEKIE